MLFSVQVRGKKKHNLMKLSHKKMYFRYLLWTIITLVAIGFGTHYCIM